MLGTACAFETSRTIVMKQTVIDILMYLFENYIDDEIELGSDDDRLKSELHEAGFESGQVSKAFDWLQDLAINRAYSEDLPAPASTSVRVFSID